MVGWWVGRWRQGLLAGKVALVTGGRVKIGFMVVLKLLRAGAHVVLTSRFPVDAAKRVAAAAAAEGAGAEWAERCAVYGLDLRDLRSLEGFIAHLTEHYDRLDILINNATQTVRRPAAYYAHLLPAEATFGGGGGAEPLNQSLRYIFFCK
eukprot:SAG11_NODE_10292_length_841_cov_2.518868_1_plen_150_part_00